MPDKFVSLGAARHAAARFRALFKGGYQRWETCGYIRRREPEGPMHLQHVVIPQAAPLTSRQDNGVTHTAQRRVAAMDLSWADAEPDPEHRLIELLEPKGWRHSIVLATRESWPAWLIEQTGPLGYWRMLLWRLRAAETLTLRGGLVCSIDRSGISEQLVPIAGVDERMFFRLARTPYRSPHARFARPTIADWAAGMLPEWYPPNARIYAPPGSAGYDTSKPSPRHFHRRRST